MANISILANIFRPPVDRRSDDTAFRAGTFSWQDPVHSWKAGAGEVMTVENLLWLYNVSYNGSFFKKIYLNWVCTLDGKGIQTTNILAFLACKIWEYTKESVSMVILHIVLLSRHPHILYYWLWSTVLWHKASYPLLMHRLVWLCGLAFSYLPTPFIALVTFFFFPLRNLSPLKLF